MPRPTWTPKTDEQRKALADLDEAAAKLAEARKRAEEVAEAEAAVAERKRNAEAEIKAASEEMRRAARGARLLKIPVREVVERTGVARATVYRRLGKGSE